MLNNLLNFDGITVLDKKQQSKVSGGESDYCLIIHRQHDGTENGWKSVTYTTSEEANAHCVEMKIGGYVASCRYDCSYDGIGK